MTASCTLAELLAGISCVLTGNAQVPIQGIAYDSRRVRPGDLFVAVPGFVHDGVRFLPEAVERGAIAGLGEVAIRPEQAGLETWAQVDSARQALAAVACRWYSNPSRELSVIGVTGTNGKTTVTALLQEILSRQSPAGRWSTTQVVVGDRRVPTPRTTPESLELQAALREMRTAGCTAAVIEVSSHALRLHRVDGTRFAAGIFTNLTRDHLDFHRDMADYLEAKADLFRRLEPEAPALINGSDDAGTEIAARCRGRVVLYGWQDRTGAVLDYAIVSLETGAEGSHLVLRTPTGTLDLDTPLFGQANAENIAAAAAAALELGCPPDQVRDAVVAFGGEPGRFERIDEGQDFTVLVDFAHTPGALEAAIAAARQLCPQATLTVVFGCGGDRDRDKRPMMGRIAAVGADRVIVTSDNPRTEPPEEIIQEILAGIPPSAAAELSVEPDRAVAIEQALTAAVPGECVLIAGKGHETEQILADRRVPFDDRSIARALLLRRMTEAQP